MSTHLNNLGVFSNFLFTYLENRKEKLFRTQNRRFNFTRNFNSQFFFRRSDKYSSRFPRKSSPLFLSYFK